MVTSLRAMLLPKDLNRVVRAVFLAVLGWALLFYIVSTRHWPMLVDSPVMHYVTFLMEHGLRPYRDITDNNMPGAYVVEHWAMLVFGGTDAGWRLYDLSLLAALMAFMVVITWPSDWLAGVCAAGLFALRHGSEGAWFAAEREQEMAVLLTGACAFLFLAVRQKRPAWAVLFGLLAGIAASIKPTLLPFSLLSLCVAAFALRRRDLASRTYVLWGLGGLFSAFFGDVFFLVRHGAVRPFLFVVRTVTPVYAALNHPGKRFLLLHVAPIEFLPLALFALFAFGMRRDWDWERWVLAVAATCGAVSYFLQGKGFYHHRYIFVCFMLLLVSLETVPLSKASSGLRWIGYCGLLYAALFVVPREIRAMRTLPAGPSALTLSLESDLSRLGEAHDLQHEVQCFDLTFGCLNSLYHLGLVENTGFTGDLLLFLPQRNAATEYYRGLFWQMQAKHAAQVIVMTNQDFGHENGFQRLDLWPQFQDYLAEHYDLAITRNFPIEDKFRGQPPAQGEAAPTYRIYLRKGGPFQALVRERQ